MSNKYYLLTYLFLNHNLSFVTVNFTSDLLTQKGNKSHACSVNMLHNALVIRWTIWCSLQTKWISWWDN